MKLRLVALLLLPLCSLGAGMREDFLSGPMAAVQEVVFAVRYPGSPSGDGHWYANFGYYAHDANRKAYGEGARLSKLNLRSGIVTTLLEDARGGIRDPQVYYDATKILFSFRPGGTEHYHLYEINVDGAGLKQLTFGDYDDIEPTYLPTGDIVFVSSRCKRWVNCWLTQVAILYRANADGTNIRPVSSNNEQDNTPWPLPDGRLLYTRWEYTDRSQVHYHHLWASNPDGTGQMIFYGNLHPGIVMIDAKPIPGSHRIVSIFSPGHGQREHAGTIAVVDPAAGPDALDFAREITKAKDLRDPWAFSEEAFLAARGPAMVLVNGAGAIQEIYRLPDADIARKLLVHEPRPLIARQRERVIPPRVDLAKRTGALILSDVSHGRNMTGVQPGEIRKLLVLETLPMPVHYTGGMEPVSYGGTFTLERIVGTVPVEPDGSAYFELPALRSFFFVALDQKGLSVKRMQSFLTVQPAETTSCVGCHEERTEAPSSMRTSLMAVHRAPSTIEPVAGVPDVIDFPRDIQPVLDHHCIRCHDYDRREGGVILSGDHGPMFSHSYYTLTIRNQVADGRNRPQSNYPPRALGSSASPLLNKLEAGHHGVQVPEAEKRIVRLWIDSGAAYPGTYAALGTGMIGSYAENQPVRPDLNWPGVKEGERAIQRRCSTCHAKELPLPLTVSHEQSLPPWDGLKVRDIRRKVSRHLLYNLSRPEKSIILLAPLAKEAGGYALCAGTVFANTTDPDYLTILGAIQESGRQFARIRRFDMPGFVPRTDWVREMKRYGILPQSHDAQEPVDYYAAERRYWESLWYSPR